MKLLVTGGMGFIGSNFIRYGRKSHFGWEITHSFEKALKDTVNWYISKSHGGEKLRV